MWINPVLRRFKPICGAARAHYTCIWVMQPPRLSRQNCAQVVDNAHSRREMPRAQNHVENCGKTALFSTDPCTAARTKTRHPRRFIHRKAAFIHRFWGNCAQIGGNAGAREGGQAVRRSAASSTVSSRWSSAPRRPAMPLLSSSSCLLAACQSLNDCSARGRAAAARVQV